VLSYVDVRAASRGFLARGRDRSAPAASASTSPAAPRSSPRRAGVPAAAQAFTEQVSPWAGLGKTSGWVHRAALKMKKVEMIPA
jgi:DNA-binding protein H-NS